MQANIEVNDQLDAFQPKPQNEDLLVLTQSRSLYKGCNLLPYIVRN